MFIVPYMVVAAVAILFFIVCRFIVYGVGGKSRHAGESGSDRGNSRASPP